MPKPVLTIAQLRAQQVKIEQQELAGDSIFVGRDGRVVRHVSERFTPAKTTDYSVEQKLVRATATVMSLVRRDSLKRCPHCGTKQYRKYHISVGHTIDISDPCNRIFRPRKSHVMKDGDQQGALRNLFNTPRYDIATGWSLIWVEVSCPNETCKGHPWHVVEERKGYRKFCPARCFCIGFASVLASDTFIIHQQSQPVSEK